MKSIEVVAAAIYKDGKVLAAQRIYKKCHASEAV